MIKLRNLDGSLKSMILEAAGLIPGAADLRYICASGGQSLTYWGQQVPDKVHNTIAAAHNAMTTGRNDVAILSPDSHSQASALTWSKNLCHMIGAYGPAFMNQRSRIGHSANFASLLTVSGYGNTFANLYFMHGRGNATNLNCLDVTGARNSFINCHFGGPFHATEAAAAGYDLVRIEAEEQYFKNCFFGGDTVANTTATLLEFTSGTPRSVFEDCIFLMNAGGANPRFIGTVAGIGLGVAFFKNCLFLNHGTALTYAIDGAGLGNFKMFFDANCSFFGATDIVAATYEASVGIGHSNYPGGDKLLNGIATTPDVS